MPSSLPLDTLTDLARKQMDIVTRELGARQSECVQAEQQLKMLEDYLDDYRQRMHETAQQGLSAAGWQNFQGFIATLESAINEQHNVLIHAKDQLRHGQVAWQQQQRRLNSFDALAKRRQQALAVRRGRIEQRASDEFAARHVQHRKEKGFA